MNINNYLKERIKKGFCFFTSAEAEQALGKSQTAIRSAIRRLKQKGELAEPIKGFHLIVPPQYSQIGCLPPDHFIPDLMEYLKCPYYVSLLSGAQYYGAAHQKPQVFQVVIEQKRRPIICGQVKINLITKKDIQDLPVREFNTRQGIIRVASPEVIAIDLVTYPHHSAGLSNAYTVLEELAESIDIQRLQTLAANSKDTTWMQRLGYLWEQLGHESLSEVLANELNHRQFRLRPLLLHAKSQGTKVNSEWKLQINIELELDYDS